MEWGSVVVIGEELRCVCEVTRTPVSPETQYSTANSHNATSQMRNFCGARKLIGKWRMRLWDWNEEDLVIE